MGTVSGSGHFLIALDPSYIDKSGKKTLGAGWFWYGCANQAKWGLEIGGIASVKTNSIFISIWPCPH